MMSIYVKLYKALNARNVKHMSIAHISSDCNISIVIWDLRFLWWRRDQSIVFWVEVLQSCGWLSTFGGTYCLFLQGMHIYPEYGSSMFPWNSSNHLLSTGQEKIPAKNSIEACVQHFIMSDELLLAILKAFIPQPLNKQQTIGFHLFTYTWHL
jgi:hypothetical protein